MDDEKDLPSISVNTYHAVESASYVMIQRRDSCLPRVRRDFFAPGVLCRRLCISSKVWALKNPWWM